MSLATAAFYGVGLLHRCRRSMASLPFAVVIIIAGAVAFVVALGVGALTLRLRGVYFAIFTFALTLLVQSVVLEVERLVTGHAGPLRGRRDARPPTTPCSSWRYSRWSWPSSSGGPAMALPCRASASMKKRRPTAASTWYGPRSWSSRRAPVVMGMAGPSSPRGGPTSTRVSPSTSTPLSGRC